MSSSTQFNYTITGSIQVTFDNTDEYLAEKTRLSSAPGYTLTSFDDAAYVLNATINLTTQGTTP